MLQHEILLAVACTVIRRDDGCRSQSFGSVLLRSRALRDSSPYDVVISTHQLPPSQPLCLFYASFITHLMKRIEVCSLAILLFFLFFPPLNLVAHPPLPCI
jgi:hypothetical protein